MTMREKAPASGAFFFSPYHQIQFAAAFIAVILAVFFLYQPALNSQPLFDDGPNLNGIEQVENFNSAMVFLSEGHGGPLGRPVALASFFINHKAWPTATDRLIWVNISIHALNGVLLFYLLFLLAGHLQPDRKKAAWTALLATTLWLYSPLLASSSLMIIQRMTTLSATFLLAGLAVFVKGRLVVIRRPRAAAFLMSTGVCLGTLLSVLSKENGVLLPLYALVIDYFLLRTTEASEPNWLRPWRWTILWLPLIAVLGYFVITWSAVVAPYEFRPFNIYERVITEPRILWAYFFQLFLPRSYLLGPFHDDVAFSTSLLNPITTLSSIVGLILAAGLAWRYKARANVPAFAVFWFLGGHLLESTFLCLELYFEHRNYVPSTGVYFAAAWLAFNAPARMRRVLATTGVLFVVFEAFILFQVTSTWGEVYAAAHLWHQAHPSSPRAAQYLAHLHLMIGREDESTRVIDTALAARPDRTDLALQALQVRCPDTTEEEFDALYNRVLGKLPKGTFAFSAIDATRKMVDMHLNGECSIRPTREQLHEIIDALMSNSAFQHSPPSMFTLHHQKARLYLDEKLVDPAISHLEQAFTIKPNLETALVIAASLGNSGRFELAIQKLDTYLKAAPRNPYLHDYWEKLINAQKKELQTALQRMAGLQKPGDTNNP